MGEESYLGDSVLDNLLIRHIALVADKELVDTLGRIAVNLLQPLLDVVERVHVRHIVDDADAVGTAVVGRGDGAEAFLAGGIPLLRLASSISLSSASTTYNLKLYRLSIELDGADFLSPC